MCYNLIFLFLQHWDKITADPKKDIGDTFDFVQYDSEIKALQQIIKNRFQSLGVN